MLVESGSDCDGILSIRIENINAVTRFPTISHNLSIYYYFHLKIHIHGVNLSPSKIEDLTKVAELFCTVSEVLNDLARIKNTLIIFLCSQYHLEAVATIILEKNSYKFNGFQDFIHSFICSFTADQLRLLSSPHNSRKYSPFC